MSHYKYLIIGGGMTAHAAVEGIRELDSSGTIGMISEEHDPPYARPPLSKALWKSDDRDTVWLNTHEHNVTIHLGKRVTSLDAAKNSVTDDGGTMYTYDRLLLATGGTPRRLPFGDDCITYFRTFADYKKLREQAQAGNRCLVIGGGFIGAEVAAALAMNGCKVTMFFPEPGIGGRVFPEQLGAYLVDYFRSKGVDVHPGETITNVERHGEEIIATTSGGQTVTADIVVAGLGIIPETTLAEQAGLDVGNGIVVNDHLQTTVPTIYAAGDVANVMIPALQRRVRVEHEDNSLTMGRAAGRAMAGDTTPYSYLPAFYSDLFDVGYEAVGLADARTETVVDWKEPLKDGVIYYLGDGRVQGVLTWNQFGLVDAARELIAQPGPFTANDLIGKLVAPE